MTDRTPTTPRQKVLIIDDDTAMRQSLLQLLQSAGFDPTACVGATAALARMATVEPDVILSDVRMPGMSGLELQAELAKLSNAPPLVLMSAHGDIAMAVGAMQAGAWSFVEKPFDPRSLIRVLQQAASHHVLSRSSARMRDDLTALSGLDRVLQGKAKVIAALRADVVDIAAANGPVLVQGATGTGKEVVARALHTLGPRRDGPFIAVNCATLDGDTFASTMFGTKDGGQGLWRAADGGTLFLDEIGSCPLVVQAQLLRVLENGIVHPVGSDVAIQTDLRIVAATHDDLTDLSAAGSFRADLLHRLTNFVLRLPTLTDRGDDVLRLYESFIASMAQTYETPPPATTAEDTAALLAHPWPGNVRELRHVAERRVLAARRGGGSAASALLNAEPADELPDTLRTAVAAFEKRLIGRALQQHAGRMEDVANALGIGRRTLNEKIVKLGLDKDALLN